MSSQRKEATRDSNPDPMGSVVGGAAWNAIASVVNPAAEDAYWRAAYSSVPYYDADRTYDDYAPAYRLGYEGRARLKGSFDAVEGELQRDWDRARGTSRLEWNEARRATRDAWERIEQTAQARILRAVLPVGSPH